MNKEATENRVVQIIEFFFVFTTVTIIQIAIDYYVAY